MADTNRDSVIITNVSTELRDRIKEVAQQNDRTMAAEVRRTLTQTYAPAGAPRS